MPEKNNIASNLGIEDNIDGVTIDEITRNKTALKMLLHNYKKISNENEMLKQDLKRQATFERGLEKKNDDSKIAGFCSLISTIAVGFAINFVTTDVHSISGWILLIIGIVMESASIYFSVREVNKNV